ncbi:hypothetical protein [Marinobacter mangrovi]|uniref:hypothetical protein n=1 Tax=Marinobacter mangrovi TaxID=2803918 RepID=UPI00193178EC|nr:hypothetical protein [Marinobacter mangrovi]
MTTRLRYSLLPATLLALMPVLGFAEGQTDRVRSAGPIETINQDMAPTAAGPGQKAAGTSVQPQRAIERPRYPNDNWTAHQKKRYLFDSNQF